MAAKVDQIEEIRLSISPLEKLAAIKAQIEDFNNQIALTEKAYGIDQLKADRDKRQADYNSMLEELIPSIEFKPDKFLEALKIKGDSYKEGSIKLIRHIEVRRSVLQDAFIKDFEKIALKICKIEVGKAEKAIGADILDKYVTKKTSYTYSLEDLKGE
jgi:hypothetical protein